MVVLTVTGIPSGANGVYELGKLSEPSLDCNPNSPRAECHSQRYSQSEQQYLQRTRLDVQDTTCSFDGEVNT